MRRRCEIRKTHVVAGQPPPLVDQITDITHVVTQIGPQRPQQLGIRWSCRLLRPHALMQLFAQKFARYLGVELPVKPVHQAPDLGPVLRMTWKWVFQALLQGRVAHHLAQVLRYRIGAR